MKARGRKNRVASLTRAMNRRDFLKLSGAGLAGTALLNVVGCGGGSTGEQGEKNVTLRLANVFEAGHPFNTCGVETLAKRVKEESDGSLNIKNFPGGQLGTEDETGELLTTQNLDISLLGPSFLARYYAPISVLNAAYIFEDADHMLKVANGEIGQELWDNLLKEANIRVLGTWYFGIRQLTTRNKAVRSPKDLAGMNIRSLEPPIMIANVEAMGAKAVPISFEELYLALQQGTVAGQENPVPTIAAEQFDEVQDYLMLTNHVVENIQVAVAESSWQMLSVEQQDVLQGLVDSVGAEVRQCIETDTEKALSEWREPSSPLQIIEDVDVEAFRQRARGTLPEDFADEWGKGLYERVQDAS